MILTDREIRVSLDQGLIRVDPTPNAQAFSSTALDLTLDSRIRIFREIVPGQEQVFSPAATGFNATALLENITTNVDLSLAEGYVLRPHHLILAWTVERVDLDLKARLAARVEGKSSLARLGLAVHVTAPTIHAGFKGQIQLEVINFGNSPIRLIPGMRICQLIFEQTLGTAEAGYSGQFRGQSST